MPVNCWCLSGCTGMWETCWCLTLALGPGPVVKFSGVYHTLGEARAAGILFSSIAMLVQAVTRVAKAGAGGIRRARPDWACRTISSISAREVRELDAALSESKYRSPQMLERCLVMCATHGTWTTGVSRQVQAPVHHHPTPSLTSHHLTSTGLFLEGLLVLEKALAQTRAGYNPQLWAAAAKCVVGVHGAQAVDELIPAMTRHAGGLSVTVADQTLLACLQLRAPMAAAVLFEAMSKAGTLPSAEVHAELVTHVSQTPARRALGPVWDALTARGIRPSAQSYNALLRDVRQADSWEPAEAVLEDMQEAGVAPNADTLKWLVSLGAHLGDAERVHAIVQELGSAGVTADLATFVEALSLWHACGKVAWVQQYAEAFVAKGGHDAMVYSILMAVQCATGQREQAMALWERIQHDPALLHHLQRSTLSELLGGFAAQENHAAVLAVHRAMEAAHALGSEQDMQCVIAAAAALHDWDHLHRALYSVLSTGLHDEGSNGTAKSVPITSSLAQQFLTHAQAASPDRIVRMFRLLQQQPGVDVSLVPLVEQLLQQGAAQDALKLALDATHATRAGVASLPRQLARQLWSTAVELQRVDAGIRVASDMIAAGMEPPVPRPALELAKLAAQTHDSALASALVHEHIALGGALTPADMDAVVLAHAGQPDTYVALASGSTPVALTRAHTPLPAEALAAAASAQFLGSSVRAGGPVLQLGTVAPVLDAVFARVHAATAPDGLPALKLWEAALSMGEPLSPASMVALLEQCVQQGGTWSLARMLAAIPTPAAADQPVPDSADALASTAHPAWSALREPRAAKALTAPWATTDVQWGPEQAPVLPVWLSLHAASGDTGRSAIAWINALCADEAHAWLPADATPGLLSTPLCQAVQDSAARLQPAALPRSAAVPAAQLLAVHGGAGATEPAAIPASVPASLARLYAGDVVDWRGALAKARSSAYLSVSSMQAGGMKPAKELRGAAVAPPMFGIKPRPCVSGQPAGWTSAWGDQIHATPGQADAWVDAVLSGISPTLLRAGAAPGRVASSTLCPELALHLAWSVLRLGLPLHDGVAHALVASLLDAGTAPESGAVGGRPCFSAALAVARAAIQAGVDMRTHALSGVLSHAAAAYERDLRTALCLLPDRAPAQAVKAVRELASSTGELAVADAL